MELRPHQQLAIDQIRHSLATRHRRPLLAAPCSFGKTLTAAYILQHAAEKGNRVIFFADRIKLISQTCDQFDSMGIKYGVIQGQHEMTDPSQLIQIASVQTIARRQKMPEFSLAIVDETHVLPQVIIKLMERYDNVPFIGLSATPYSKGLGKYYDDLIVPITPAELLEQGYLAPVHYYGGSHVDMSKIKMKAISTGGSDYDPDQLAEATEQQQEKLIGDIVRNWKLYGENSQTIAFSPSIKHSKYLVEMFNREGIPAAHIDGYTEESARQVLYKAHNNNEFKILSCSRLLNTGYDAPQVKCLIDCFPTKSIIAYQQRAGRIMRIHPDKTHAIYLDHASNVQRFGFAENIVPTILDDGEKKFAEKDQIKEVKETKQKDCPMCLKIMIGLRCSCGYEISIRERIETDGSTLVKIANLKAYTHASKSMWYSGFLTYARNKGFSDGWAAWKYKGKFGVFPRSLEIRVGQIPIEVQSYITSENIRYSKSQENSGNRHKNKVK